MNFFKQLSWFAVCIKTLWGHFLEDRQMMLSRKKFKMIKARELNLADSFTYLHENPSINLFHAFQSIACLSLTTRIGSVLELPPGS